MTPVRRNVAHLTDEERRKYIDAVVAADQRFWSGGPVSYWDFQDLAHQTTHVHGGPKFLLWHRELCNRYERLLQEIDPDVALHYWDWTTDPRSSPNGAGGTTDLSTDTFMGTMNGHVAGKLRPLHNGGVLAGSRDATGLPQDPPQTIERNLPPGPPRVGGAAVPADNTLITTGAALPQAQQFRAFREFLEQVHGGVHVSFGAGNIGDPSGHEAFQDPFVFLLHANVDRLFAMWQCQPGQTWRLDAAQVYGLEADTPGEDGLRDNTLAPWDGSSGAYPFTPAGGLVQLKPYLDPSLAVPPCYDTLPTTVTQVAPALSTPMRFIHVPTGKETARALRLTVRGCGQVNVQGVLAGDPAFTLHQANVQSPPHDGFGTTTVVLWVKYRGGAPGSAATGQLRATCPETGDIFTVDLEADSIAKPTVAVSMVLDSSGSMAEPSGVPGLDRMGVLRQAAPTFLALLDDADGVGVVRFDTDAAAVSPVSTAGAVGTGGGRDSAMAAVNAHATNPAGLTAIGDGIEAAHTQLVAAPGFMQRAMVVFTDGFETEAKYIADVSSLIDDRVYAVGLGTADQLRPTGLSAIVQGTGYLLMTGMLGTDGVMHLAKYFTQVLAGVTNTQIVTDPPGFVQSGRTEKVPFVLTEADQQCDVIVLTEAPFALRLTLTAPDGTVVAAGPDAQALDAPAMRCLRVPLPLASAPQTHAGTWTANLEVDDRRLSRYVATLEKRQDLLGIARLRAHGLAYRLNVHAQSDLTMQVQVTPAGHTPGSTVHLRAVLTEADIPLQRQATVGVDVTRPDGTAVTITLQETDPGVHTGTLVLPLPGPYPLLVRAQGQSLRGTPFTREEVRSAGVWADPIIPPRADDSREAWCDLLTCLLADQRNARTLEKLGWNVDGLQKCVARMCNRG